MYRRSVKIALILVYLVIIAGAVVRMTGSGMGCPDWPKCFGYYIPPTEISELQFQPNRVYNEGQVIILDETLRVAKSDFTSAESFNSLNWEIYKEHDYAIFNPWHTWIEYINRLFGALAGLGVLVMAFFSFSQWKYKKRITILSWFSVFMMGFQGWLGATVVYSVLSPVKITIHMVVALLIVAILLYLLFISKYTTTTNQETTKSFQNLMILAIVLTMIQVVLGTQVREFVDEQVKLLGDSSQHLWLANPDLNFFLHRSFSIAILLVNLYLFWENRNYKLRLSKINIVIVLLILEVITGIAMYNFDFPFLSQPLHLVIATAIFAYQFYLFLEAMRAPIKVKSL